MEQAVPNLWQKTRITLEMIKWEHSIFALPFALTATLLAAWSHPGATGLRPATLGWILLAMVSARSAAMAFNRWADARLDATNPRTRGRAIPAGLLTSSFVFGFTVVTTAIFVLAAAQLNRLTLMLSPVALLVLLGYSYLKRFTRWAHIGLGLALGIAPSAAWIAVRGSLDVRIILLTAAVLCWVGGFDVLYACQDYEHDCREGLHSIPQSFGLVGAFWIARVMHLLMLALMVALGLAFGFHLVAWIGIAIVALLIAYEHSLVKPTDISRMDAAFFTMNGVIAAVFFLFVAIDLWLHK